MAGLRRCAKAAFEQFDIAGILVWQSKIPNLLWVFVAAYQDSIIACWEQGICFLEERVLEMQQEESHPDREHVRGELYQSFSLLYILAKERKKLRKTSYPQIGWRERLRLPWCKTRIIKKAEKEREKRIKAALEKAKKQSCS